MATKRQRRFEEIQDKKKKKSTRIFYFSLIMGGLAVLLIIFFVIVFNAVFPPVDVNAGKKKEKRLVIVYFSDPQERFLKPEKRYIFVTDETSQQVKEITKALLDGSVHRGLYGKTGTQGIIGRALINTAIGFG